jgi:FlaG/FlaF family flagellin (archaellin)
MESAARLGGGADAAARQSVIATYLPEKPKTQEHCRIIIEHMQELLMVLEMWSVNGDISASAKKSSVSKNRRSNQYKSSSNNKSINIDATLRGLHNIEAPGESHGDSVAFLFPPSTKSLRPPIFSTDDADK